MQQMYNPQEIIDKADRMTQQADELKKQITRMESIVEQIGSVWQSPAQKQFAAKFAEIQRPLLEFCKQIDAFAGEAKTQAQDVLRLEAE